MKKTITVILITLTMITFTSCEKEQENHCDMYLIEYEQALKTYEDAKLIYDDNTNYGKTQLAYYEMLMTKAKQEYQKCIYY